MTRNVPTTSYATRTPVTTENTARFQVGFIMTQALDFLMTQDDNYLVIQSSIVSNSTARSQVTTPYS